MKFNFRADNKLFLAPLAGISDPAFRLLSQRMGAGFLISELTSVDFIYSQKQKALEKVERDLKEKNLGLQLFGKNPSKIGDAMSVVEDKFDFFDFNAGCPASNILEQGAGANLMSDPVLLEKMLSGIINCTNKPVTLKFRLGLNEKSESFLSVGKLAEDLGVSLVSLHARYASQGYGGFADWSKIKSLKDSLNIPVVGNGDVSSPLLAKQLFDSTGCDFVMVGRWAMGNPWCFSQINSFLSSGSYDVLDDASRIKGFFDYLSLSKKFNISFARKKIHAMHFTKNILGGKLLRSNIARACDEEQIINTLNDFLEK